MLLQPQQIHDIHAIAIELGLHAQRDALLSGLPNQVSAGLPKTSNDAAQLLQDLNALNQKPLPDNNADPDLIFWLSAALALGASDPRSEVFSKAIQEIRTAQSRLPLPNPSASPLASRSSHSKVWIALSLSLLAILGAVLWNTPFNNTPAPAPSSSSLAGKSTPIPTAPPSPSTPPLSVASAIKAPAPSSSGPRPSASLVMPSAFAPPPPPDATSGSAYCAGSQCTLTASSGVFNQAIGACLKAEIKGIKLTCKVAGSPQGVQKVPCNRSDLASSEPFHGATSWTKCSN